MENIKYSYYHSASKIPLVYRTIGEQLQSLAQKFGNREAIVTVNDGQRLTYAELLQKVDQLAYAFLKMGLRKGDKIGIWSPNTMEYLLLILASSRAGLVNVPINAAYQCSEVAHCIKLVDMKAIFTIETFKTQNYYKMLCEIIPELSSSVPGKLASPEYPMLLHVIIDSSAHLPGTYNFTDITKMVRDDDLLELPNVCADDPFQILFTSGTTGKPKGAVITHFNYWNTGRFMDERLDSSADANVHHRIVLQCPLASAIVMIGNVWGGLVIGATFIIAGFYFRPNESLKAIDAEKATVIIGTPTMFIDLIQKQKELNLNMDSLRFAIIGGAISTPQLIQDITATLKPKCIRNIYGMTEVGLICMTRGDEDLSLLTGTVGYLIDHLEARVVDRAGNLVPMGTDGELQIRSFSVMPGYYKDSVKTKESMADNRWFRTGDRCILQPNGYAQILGRYKDIIIRGGTNIYPKEIESCLVTHPDVLDACVIAVPDDRLGEAVCAYIRLINSRKSVTQQNIAEFCLGKLAHFKIPQHVRIVEDFPKSSVGKVLKNRLKELFLSDL